MSILKPVDESEENIFKSINRIKFIKCINYISMTTDNTHKVDNIQARYVLENVIGEAEIQMLKSLKESKISVFETRKTGYGYFI